MSELCRSNCTKGIVCAHNCGKMVGVRKVIARNHRRWARGMRNPLLIGRLMFGGSKLSSMLYPACLRLSSNSPSSSSILFSKVGDILAMEPCFQCLFRRFTRPRIRRSTVFYLSSPSTAPQPALINCRRKDFSTTSPRNAESSLRSGERSSPSRGSSASSQRPRSITPSEQQRSTLPPTSTLGKGPESMRQINNMLGAGERKGWPQAPSPQNRSSVASQFDDLFGNRSTQNSKDRASGPTDDILDLFREFKDDTGIQAQRDRVRTGEKFDQQRLAAQLSTSRLDDFKDDMSLRLKPALGRSVNLLNLSGGKDLTRAFRQLEMKCAANSVRADEREQRTHIRRGMRKKLERRKRWRILFKEGFLAECARVRRMRKQGW